MTYKIVLKLFSSPLFASLLNPLSSCIRFRLATRATLRAGSAALAFGSSYLHSEMTTMQSPAMTGDRITHILIAWSKNPALPLVVISGWVRPGSTWYRLVQVSVIFGAKNCGRARISACNLARICKKAIC